MTRRFLAKLTGSALSATVFAAMLLAIPTAVQAQDDWGVDGGSDRRAEIISRYRDILERRPEEGSIFDRLIQEVGGGSGLLSLIDEYAALTVEEPGNYAYWMLLGHLQRRADLVAESLVAYEQAVEIEPTNPQVHISLGNTYRQLDQRDQSRLSYETALELTTEIEDQRDVLRALADLAFDAHEWDEAGGYVQRLVDLEPGNAYVRMELAELFIRHERYDDALAQYEAVRDDAGHDTQQRAVAIKDIGDVLSLMGQWEEAIEMYRSAMRLVDEGYWLRRELEQRIISVHRANDRLAELVEYYEEDWGSPNFEQLMLLSSLYDELGREDDALAMLRSAVRRDSRSIDARLALIQMLERRGEMEEVIGVYEDLIDDNPNDSSMRFRLIEILRRRGDRDGAVAILEDAARRYASNPGVLLQCAELYLRFGMNDEALAAYERLVRIDPDNPDNRIALGEYHFMEGRRTEGENVWRQILDIMDDPAEGHALLGDVYADHSLSEEAVIEYEEAVGLEPDNDQYLHALAEMYTDVGRFPLALRRWEQLLDRSQQSHIRAESRTAIIGIYADLGQLQDVIPGYRDEFGGDPPSLEAGYFLGEAYLHLDQDGMAEAIFDEILLADAEDLHALLALERIYSRQNRLRDAVDVLIRIADLSPGRARETYHRLAEISLRLYDDDEAIRFAQLAIEMNPDDASAHARLGEIYRQMQDLDRAVLAYRQALSLDGRAWAYSFDLAEIFLALGRSGDADDLYQAIMSSSNDEVDILRAGRRSVQIHQADGSLADLVSTLEPLAFRPNLGETYLKLLVELFDRLTLPLIQQAEYGLTEQRAQAEVELTEISRRALRPLLDALSGDDISMRTTALRVLGGLRSPNAALPVARLLDGTDLDLQLQAALVVGRIGDSRATAPLLRIADNGEGAVRTVAVWALARAGGEDAAPYLFELATDASAPDDLRALALSGLVRHGLPRAEEAVAALILDEAQGVQTVAVWGAGLLGLEGVRDDVHLLLAHGRSMVPQAAAFALGLMPPDDASIDALLQAYLRGTNLLRSHAGQALMRLGSAEFDDNPLTRFEIAMPFYSTTNQSFDVDSYLSGLLSWDLLYGERSGEALLRDHAGRVVDGLLSALDGNLLIQRTVLGDLSQNPGCVAPGTLVAGVDQVARQAVCDGLTPLFANHAAQFVEAMGSPDAVVRTHSATIVGVLAADQPQLVEALVAALNVETEVSTARSILLAIAHADSGGDATALIEASTSSDWMVRAAALRALAIAAPDRTDVLIERYETDAFASVRAAAFEALAQASPAQAAELAVADWTSSPLVVRLAMVRARGSYGADQRAWIEAQAASDADATVRGAVR